MISLSEVVPLSGVSFKVKNSEILIDKYVNTNTNGGRGQVMPNPLLIFQYYIVTLRVPKVYVCTSSKFEHMHSQIATQ